MSPRDKDIVQLFLLTARRLLLIFRTLLMEHVRQHLAIAVSLLVDLHLLVSLLLKPLKILKQRLLLFHLTLHLPQKGVQVTSRYWLLHR